MVSESDTDVTARGWVGVGVGVGSHAVARRGSVVCAHVELAEAFQPGPSN